MAVGSITSQPVCVAPVGDQCGEGAVWHSAHSAVYWTDINRFLIHRFTIADQCVRTWIFDEPVTAIALTDRDDVLVVALGSGVILWEPASDVRHKPIFRLEGWPEVRLNDGRADPCGSFWVGSMYNNVLPDGSTREIVGKHGILFRIDPDSSTSVHLREIGVSNTLCWRPDRRRFYFADSTANRIWSYDYDPSTGAINNEVDFLVDFERGLPDGSAMDAEGYLWNCRYYGGCIVRVSPDGKVDRVIEMPARNITTCTFGGADLKTLFVTTAASGEPPSARLAGGLFAMQCEVRGQPENKFRVFGH